DLCGEPTPLSHYLKYGASKGLSPARLFDRAHYVGQLSETLPDGIDALSHYLRGGRHALVNPHADFDTRFYLNEARTTQNPLLHRLRIDRVHVPHLFGLEDSLAEILSRLELPFDLTLHDYYLLSPNPHLSTRDGRYVGLPALENEDALLATSLPAPPSSVRDW